MKIGVYGSAAGEINDEMKQKAAEIGRLVAFYKGSIITGACAGLPHEAVLNSKRNGGYTKGFSPFSSKEEHLSNGFPADNFDEIVFTGAGKKGRNVASVHNCDAAIFISGRTGTINEFTIAYDDFNENQVIGVLTGTGGFADEAEALIKKLGKPTKAKIFYSNNPKKLIEKIMGAKMNQKDKIFVALDVDSAEKALSLADELKDYVGGYKIGKQLFTAAGPELVKSIASHSKVFLDLKYHDIPNTVAGAAKEAAKLGVYMFNIHASGGYEMMKAAVDAVKETEGKKPLVLGVTVLTSIDQQKMNNEVRIPGDVKEQVIHLAKLSKQAGCDGVIASAKETKMIKEACGDDFLVVTPGIRPVWAASGDQKRVVTPSNALADGSDYLVIGRAITGQPDRIEAAKKINNEIEG